MFPVARNPSGRSDIRGAPQCRRPIPPLEPARDLGKALVVDDEPVIRALYSEVLAAMGFKVDTAPTAWKAWSVSRRAPTT